MSNFHQPRRGWLPQLFDGLKLAVLGIFLISYLALSMPSYKFQLPKDGQKVEQFEEISDLQGDSIK